MHLYFFAFLGGLALFLYGMQIMGEGLQKAAGNKMEKILETIDDCACVIAIRIGESPKEKLTAKGIHTLMSYGRIEEAVAQAVEELKTENGKETVL